MIRPLSRIAAAALSAAALLTAAGPAHAAAAARSYQYISDAGFAPGAHSITLGGTYQGQTTTLDSPLDLGSFGVPANFLAGETRIYQNTPFTIDLKIAPAGDGPVNLWDPAVAYDYRISGVINGSLRADGTSTLLPSIVSITGSGSIAAPFPVEDLRISLPLIAAPTGSLDASTPLVGVVALDSTGNPLPSPAPEPTSVAVFAAALAGFAWNRRRSRARAHAASA